MDEEYWNAVDSEDQQEYDVNRLTKEYTVAEWETKSGTRGTMTVKPLGCIVWLVVIFLLVAACTHH